jgi:hypothetical protein
VHLSTLRTCLYAYRTGDDVCPHVMASGKRVARSCCNSVFSAEIFHLGPLQGKGKSLAKKSVFLFGFLVYQVVNHVEQGQ